MSFATTRYHANDVAPLMRGHGNDVAFLRAAAGMRKAKKHGSENSPVLNCYGEEKIIIIFKVVTVMSVMRLHARNKS